jgi:general secretion pathway protein M
MLETLLKNWQQLQARERLMLASGGIVVFGILFYVFILQPWHAAINHMQSALPFKRAELVWMRQTAELVQQGGTISSQKPRGHGQSLMAVIEQTAKANGVSSAIQQMVPSENDQQVSVVLEGVSFNNWIKWVASLQTEYGVSIKQLTADREDDQPDSAEIRLTLIR